MWASLFDTESDSDSETANGTSYIVTFAMQVLNVRVI